jgi:hypothetical protein
MQHIFESLKFTRGLNAVAAGVTVQNGAVIDMSGFEGVIFVALLGALTATQVTALKAQTGNANDGSDAADITGAVTANMADADSNKILVLDVFRPQKRYVRGVVTRGTANAVIDGLLVIQYGAKSRPSVNDATTTSQTKGKIG